jgi:hypothetical protein
MLGLAGLVACSDDEVASSTETNGSLDTTATATSSDDTAPTTSENVSTTDVGPQRLYSGVLEPGDYVGNQFEHPVTLSVGEGWRSAESFGTISLVEDSTDDSGGGLAIIDAVSEMSANEVLTRLVDREGITFSEPAPTTITGFDGVVVTAEPPAEDVVFRFIEDSQGSWYTPAGVRTEVHIVETPTGTRLIWIEAPPARWESFYPSARSVIDSIVWAE